ncbi:serine hydrolase domain-containing protein [Flavobacterium rakeshii]|uniref:serine hydrolase domain-containing protein n=1 Tax=Flavobacterium rakeshii TaxID=1038845 RepID=UPI002E7B1E1B|nr:serine hydrolase domain-containing protein [Flavobacterium rakeshii]MEE1896871.1 serine hydrolase domain-containing protein [Flavobacterium rakeshii]
MKKISALLLVLLPLIAFSQNNFKAIDSVLSVYDQGVVPGVSVSIAKNGKVIYSRNVGYADIEANKKIDDKTLFCMASVSKQFTAACIVMLEQQGKLSLEDKLSKYFPDFPEYANTISIVHLLNHTSGIKDYLTLSMLRGHDNKDYTNEMVEDMLRVQELDFEPGSTFSYTNSGYWFLVRIIEKVSGKSIIDFAQENIFRPLKMKNTQYAYDPYLVKHMSKGYVETDEGYEIEPQKEYVISGAGVVSSVQDMQKWLFEMYTQKVFGTAFWHRMLNEEFYDLGNNNFSTKGLFTGDYYGVKRIQHGGDVDGFHTVVECFPEQGVTVAIFTNNDNVNVYEFNKPALSSLLNLKYKKEVVKTEEPPIFDPVSETDLKQYEGDYGSELGLFFNVSVKDGVLYVIQKWDGGGYPVVQAGANKFKIEGDPVFFEFIDINNGMANLLKVNQEDGEYVFKRDYQLPDFGDYLGKYYSKVLDVNYEFYLEGGLLVFSPQGVDEVRVATINEKDKATSPWGDLSFVRDNQGVITGFLLSHDRAMNIEFVKVPAIE